MGLQSTNFQFAFSFFFARTLSQVPQVHSIQLTLPDESFGVGYSKMTVTATQTGRVHQTTPACAAEKSLLGRQRQRRPQLYTLLRSFTKPWRTLASVVHHVVLTKLPFARNTVQKTLGSRAAVRGGAGESVFLSRLSPRIKSYCYLGCRSHAGT